MSGEEARFRLANGVPWDHSGDAWTALIAAAACVAIAGLGGPPVAASLTAAGSRARPSALKTGPLGCSANWTRKKTAISRSVEPLNRPPPAAGAASP